MSRARRLAGLPPPNDDSIIIKSNNKRSSISPSSKSIQPIKKIIVPKNLKSSRKLSRFESRIQPTSNVALNKKSQQGIKEMDFDKGGEGGVKFSDDKSDMDNSMNVDDVKKESNTIEQSTSTSTLPKVKSQKQIFQIPIKSASIETRLPKFHKERFEQPENPYLLKVVVLGTPNSGKSTMLNALFGETMSVVSNKAHTTRERISVVFTEENKQLVFIDTPGIVPGHNRPKLNRGLINASWHSIHEADHVLVIIDAFRALYRTTYAESWLLDRLLKEYKLPGTLVLNKIDLLSNEKESIPYIYKKFTSQYPYFKDKTSISALKRTGITNLKEILLSNAHPHDWICPPEQRIDMADMKRVEDFIRAEIFERLRDNLPYAVRQENVGWTDLPNNILRIDQNIYTDYPSQQKILIGANGTVIKTIGVRAATKLSAVFGKTVRLYLTVKSKKLEKNKTRY
ncbi:17269_t:CDS:2 [Funneliformis geosporum]|uniref:7534_t:CDS:1 n=1 Tax=Funneliformis geosporum TaxID=1117311 RepID=A0A9W4WKW5_9GLOM|nr:7534_t:CDS:2 [Funneliformis geosporum]CAI2161668.1 17269_t:CDS:2 [Funneliformis geosporum]